MTEDFLLTTTYDASSGEHRISAYQLLYQNVDTTLRALKSHHPSMHAFASIVVPHYDTGILFASSDEHILLASDFEKYFDISLSEIDFGIAEFIENLHFYFELEKISNRLDTK